VDCRRRLRGIPDDAARHRHRLRAVTIERERLWYPMNELAALLVQIADRAVEQVCRYAVIGQRYIEVSADSGTLRGVHRGRNLAGGLG